MFPPTDILLDSRAAAHHVNVAYEHFVRLRAAGRTPPPDGWRGKQALYSTATLDAWLAARGGKKTWRVGPESTPESSSAA